MKINEFSMLSNIRKNFYFILRYYEIFVVIIIIIIFLVFILLAFNIMLLYLSFEN